MCNESCIEFGQKTLKEEDIRGKSVIEVGSFDVNGSLRPLVESFGPGIYVGVDIEKGPGVDRLCKIEDLISEFGADKFDVLICTEVLEHVEDWREGVHNLKHVLKPGGMLLVTTRSRGFPYHGCSFDFWRYKLSDIKNIFSDFKIDVLEKDPGVPGILLAARKPDNFKEKCFKGYKLYSVASRNKKDIIIDIVYYKTYQFSSRVIYYIKHPLEISAMIRRKWNKYHAWRGLYIRTKEIDGSGEY